MTRAARWLMALCGAMAISPGWAVAEEFKLVLEPEAGQMVPARVCLVSRARAMADARGQGPIALTEHAECAGAPDGQCFVPRGPTSAECATCPSTPHPACRGRVHVAGQPLEALSIVCADDLAYAARGGTVYIAVETVEAESPPAFFGLEVDGGRVRWSPINRVSRPSYRVIGGDFMPSSRSYPRERTPVEWVSVPLRRRCRCLPMKQPVGGLAVDRVDLDGAETCHGEPYADGTVSVEVGANQVGSTRTLTVGTASSEAVMRWSGAWPRAHRRARLVRYEFALQPGCVTPRGVDCPTLTADHSTCTTEPMVGGGCRYDCRVLPHRTVTLPLRFDLTVPGPGVQWEVTLRSPGQAITAQPPPGARVLTARLPDAPLDTPGDRLLAVTIDRQGLESQRILLDGTDPLHVPLSGMRCGAPLAVRYEGDRAFRWTTLRVQPGGEVQLPPPRGTAQRVRLEGLFMAGFGGKWPLTGDFDLETASDDLLTIAAYAALRSRTFGSRWSFVAQLGVAFSPDWLGALGARFADGAEFTGTVDEELAVGLIELHLRRAYADSGGGGEFYVGLGVGGGYALGDSNVTEVGLIRVLTGVIGTRRAIEASSPWSLVLELRAMGSFQVPPIGLLDTTSSEADDEAWTTGGMDPSVFVGYDTGDPYDVLAIVGLFGVSYAF